MSTRVSEQITGKCCNWNTKANSTCIGEEFVNFTRNFRLLKREKKESPNALANGWESKEIHLWQISLLCRGWKGKNKENGIDRWILSVWECFEVISESCITGPMHPGWYINQMHCHIIGFDLIILACMHCPYVQWERRNPFAMEPPIYWPFPTAKYQRYFSYDDRENGQKGRKANRNETISDHRCLYKAAIYCCELIY